MSDKNLRMRVADVIGVTNSSPEARAIYMLVDKIEVLEADNADLRRAIVTRNTKRGGRDGAS